MAERLPVDDATNALVEQVIGAAIEVHRELGGPGLLEEIYEEAFARELELRAIRYERQCPVPVVYKGHRLIKRYVLDLLIERRLIVELKATIEDNPIFRSQCLTQLRITNFHLGLVINFG